MKFAKRVKGIDSSHIREILKLTQRSEIISFAGGLPDPRLFPTKEIRRCANEVLKSAPLSRGALQYGESASYLPLAEVIASSYRKKDKIKAKAEQVIITNGSQQALDLLAKVLIDEGDGVLLESPTYLAALQAFSFYKPAFKTLELEKDGPREPYDFTGVKLAYCIPNFQNPSGISWSNEKRKSFAEMAKKEGVLLVEDDPYGEIRFSGKRPKTLKKFNDDTILLGSFSKILAPGLRLGWMLVSNEELREKILLAKQASDLLSNNLAQYVVWRLYESFDVQGHIEKISAEYKKRKSVMCEALDRQMPELERTDPEGGMFLWVSFPKGTDSEELLKFAVKEGVAFVPGTPFFAEKNAPRNMARLNYTNSSCKEIEEGVSRLKKALQKYLKSV